MKKLATLDQRSQRELAWLLYITEGYAANISHALAVNAYTLHPRALRIMRAQLRRAEQACLDLRRDLKELHKWTSLDPQAVAPLPSAVGTSDKTGKSA